MAKRDIDTRFAEAWCIFWPAAFFVLLAVLVAVLLR